MLHDYLPVEGTRDLLRLLLAWLRGQETQELAERLQSPSRDIYRQMRAEVEQEEEQRN